LLRVLSCCEPEHTANITQAIAFTKHSRAESILREHLELLWQHGQLWEDASFINWIAFSATTCIAHLIEVGTPTAHFTEKVHQLSTHVCSRNRESCSIFLAKHYSWLNPPTPSRWAST
jgi:hypothetical protein